MEVSFYWRLSSSVWAIARNPRGWDLGSVVARKQEEIFRQLWYQNAIWLASGFCGMCAMVPHLAWTKRTSDYGFPSTCLVNGDVRPIFVERIRSDKPLEANCSPNHNFEWRQLTFNRLHCILVERPKVLVLLLGDTITTKPWFVAKPNFGKNVFFPEQTLAGCNPDLPLPFC